MVKHRGDDICGVILLDKPSGRSSNFYLQRIKYMLNAKKAGHTGSLDPLATGLLPMCFGKATCLSEYFLHSEKAYEAVIQLGVTTSSHDCDGEVISTQDVSVTEAQFQDVLKQFVGEVEQIPPMVSALKHNGQPLYKLALKGKEIERKPRKMNVYSLDGSLAEKNQAKITVRCSSGFYVRQLAADIGEKLGCGAHIAELRRIESKNLTLEGAVFYEETIELLEGAGTDVRDEFLRKHLIPADKILSFLPKVMLNDVDADHVTNGRKLPWPEIEGHVPGQHVLVYQIVADSEPHFIGIGRESGENLLKVRKVFNPAIGKSCS